MYARIFKGHTGLKFLSLTAGLYLLGDEYRNRNRFRVHSCGIVGYCGVKKQGTKFTLDGIQLLQNRGYDSAGICTINEQGEFTLTKHASNTYKNIDCIDLLKQIVPSKHGESYCGIGHTRWATCGGKTDENAHPHMDYQERIALVHNGTVENVDELRKEILSKGIILKSQTDTEIIAQVIGLYMDTGKSVLEAAKEAFSKKIQGTWGIVIIQPDKPNQMIVCRNGSPLLISSNDDAIFVASEQIALEKYTSNFFMLEDMEILELDVKNRKDLFETFKTRVQKVHKVNAQILPKDPYDFFYIQEIKEQPDALMKCLNYGGRLAGEKGTPKLGGLEIQAERLVNIDHMVIAACGTSYYAALYAQRIFKQLRCFQTIQVYEATEIHENDFPLERGGLIVVSQSGETHDVKKAIKIAKEKGFLSIGVVNVVGSSIATMVDCGVYTNCGREVAVAATKSFSCQLLALVMIAIWITHRKKSPETFLLRQELLKSLQQIPSYVGKTLLKVKNMVSEAAQICKNENNLFILGKHSTYPIAKEAALKTKEITYIHTEGYSAGDFINSSLYLLSDNPEQQTKVFYLMLKEDNIQEHINILAKLKEHNAFVIIVSDCISQIPHQNYDLSIEIPSIGLLTGFLCILPFHLFSYEVCKLLGRNPDKPRNLAKTVTVG